MGNRDYYVYMMSNISKTIYTGVTNNIHLRVLQHKYGVNKGFTSRYRINKLVYFEWTDSIDAAIKREKQLKNWHRDWKINLIESVNRNWDDLSAGWYDEIDPNEVLKGYDGK
ncbi:MAG: GIY-YIG nuclease family protein [Ignavibacteria bacterium]|nr:GIY-YIG nuclease family protein [Ignavibacteria bacterium]